jgi:hypothetical protein
MNVEMVVIMVHGSQGVSRSPQREIHLKGFVRAESDQSVESNLYFPLFQKL